MKEKTVALIGNPNVGKSTVFNEITGSHRHTGNWSGKTVDIAEGKYYYKYNNYRLIDLPGTYSLLPSSEEEKVAADYLLREKYDCVIVVMDSAALLRNLNLFYQIFEITNKLVVLLNLSDEAKKRGISVNSEILENLLGVPVIKSTARSGKGINELLEAVHLIVTNSEDYYRKTDVDISKTDAENFLYKSRFVEEKAVRALPSKKERREAAFDRLVLGKHTAVLFMTAVLAVILWITIKVSNYPSEFLSEIFLKFENILTVKMKSSGISDTAVSLIVDGMLKTLLWIIAVMLPPMAIFFPLFTLLEDFGLLPRLAFNCDRPFEKCSVCGKQALTVCMGLGCNAVGVTGARIIDSPRERAVAVITNSLTPCNGRFPLLIAVISIFMSKNSFLGAIILLAFLLLSFSVTLLCSKLLGETAFKGDGAPLIFELPKYRTPDFPRVIKDTVREKIIRVLLRAAAAALPSGIIIWLLSGITVNGVSLLCKISDFLNPIGSFIGLDGIMLFAFILGFPANEIVLPIALMGYLSADKMSGYSSLESLGEILFSNGWTLKTAVCCCIFSMFHFPCATTLLTVIRETKSARQTVLSIFVPLICGITLCALTNAVFSLF